MGIIHQTTQAFDTCSHLGFGGVSKSTNDRVNNSGLESVGKANEKPDSNVFKKD
jgi:hypothetical protein